jgi:cytochrome c-type biogenesis protein CcmH
MRNHYLTFGITVCTLLLFAVPLSAQSQVSLMEIKKSILCLCDCNMTVEACEGAMACQSSENLTREAAELIDKGMNKKQVLASFVTRYGEHILAAPTKRGFNLTAWILPFAVIIIAGFGIITVLRRWVHLSERKSEKSKVNRDNAVDKEYEEKLRKVLHELD